MEPHHVARLRLLALGVFVFALAAAVALVVTLTHNQLAGTDARHSFVVLAAWLLLSAVPALVLTPLIGPVAGSRWARPVLVGIAAATVGLTAAGAAKPTVSWLSIAGMLALLSAFTGAIVVAAIPVAARAARWRVPGVFVSFALVAVVGILAGIWFTRYGLAAAHWGVGASTVAFVASVFFRFDPADPVHLSRGLLRPFLAGAREAVRSTRPRSALLGLMAWGFMALAVVVLIWSEATSATVRQVETLTLTLLIAALGGVLVAGLNRNSFRHAWTVPFAATAAVVCLVCLRFGESWRGPLIGLGICLGATFTPLVNSYLTWIGPKYHGVGVGLVVAALSAAAVALAVVLIAMPPWPDGRLALLTVLLVVTGLAAIGSWFAFSRPALEGIVELPILAMYRIRATGPGLDHLPARGPCLVIGNHAAWFDPLFLAKVLPLPTTPMMTSKFYDLPVLAWLMRYVVGTIRVPDATLRHDAPELKEAVAALDRGDCIVLFPEGYLRRKEEVPLRRFGRGVWQILRDRPSTPVFATWIDGNWGSYFSHKGGPPGKNKKIDLRRPIRIGVIGPITVDAATLADHMATRSFLMNEVNRAREPLGLEPLPLAAVPEGDKE